MVKSYLILEDKKEGEITFPLEQRVTIGRAPSNIIHLYDKSVSRQHAMVYLMEEQVFIKDLKSHNGTFVNGNKVTSAVLSRGDRLQLGRVTFRFLQEEVSQADENRLESQEVLESAISVGAGSNDLSPECRSLMDTISGVPPFSDLDQDSLAKLGQTAHLVISDRGRTIVHQGDRGKSLFIILNGKVRVFIHDNKGEELIINTLGDNQFFGEISLLTGAPRSATVQAVEETLLCELSYKVLRVVMSLSPIMKSILEGHCRERLQELEEKKKATGLVERRLHWRLNEKVPVRFSVSTTSSLSSRYRGKIFQSVSQDLSFSGVRLRAQDRSLQHLPMNCQLRLEIFLPKPVGSIRCLGVLRNMTNGKESKGFVFLGIEITEMPSIHRKKLEQFLRC